MFFSLATLRNFAIEHGDGGSDETPVTSVSAHSVISAVPSQEIHRMVQEVNVLDEETVKVNNLLCFMHTVCTKYNLQLYRKVKQKERLAPLPSCYCTNSVLYVVDGDFCLMTSPLFEMCCTHFCYSPYSP